MDVDFEKADLGQLDNGADFGNTPESLDLESSQTDEMPSNLTKTPIANNDVPITFDKDYTQPDDPYRESNILDG
jgi:hypothetical protein